MTSVNRKSKGQIAIIFTLVLPVLLGALALCCDVAVNYANWARMQRAADAAVLAGATYLPHDPASAQSTAQSWAVTNGIATSEITSTQVAPDDKSISISVQRTVPYYFGRVLGLTDSIVQVAATAGVQPVMSAGGPGLVPLGVQCAQVPCFTVGQSTTLSVSLKGQQFSPGNWGPLALGASGGNQYRNNIENGYNGTVNIGDWVPTETGNVVGPTDQGFSTRISNGTATDSSGTPDVHALGDQRVIEVPLVNFNSPNGKSSVQITGFAMFWLTSSSGGNVKGVFLQEVAQDNVPNPNSTDTGAYAPVLLQ